MTKKKHKDEISKADQEYLKGTPTRMEVGNYVNGLVDGHYMPKIIEMFNDVDASARLGIMATQAILISKGICTADELSEAVEALTQAAKDSAAKDSSDKGPDDSGETEQDA